MPRKFLNIILVLCLLPFSNVQAEQITLPVPGTMVMLSPAYAPPILKGIKVHTDNPFKFEFILDRGSLPPVGRVREGVEQEQLKDESTKLIKYFLASLTTPEKDLWVNLSPYEKDRIVPESFGQTEMGRDLLAQDYILKQLTASLVYPEEELGKKFWKMVYEQAASKNIPINTFNKVWIVPNKAVVYENAKNGTAYVVESSLKVMTEQDYEATNKNTTVGEDLVSSRHAGQTQDRPLRNIDNSKIIRDIVIPQLTKEVNQGANFAQLRQVYNSLILATWYKKKIRDSILAKVYADKKKTKGLEYKSIKNAFVGEDLVSSRKGTTNHSNGPTQGRPLRTDNDVELIYAQYLQAFKKGAYNYIKEEQDPISKELVPRKYFSGGVVLDISKAMTATVMQPAENHDFALIAVNMQPVEQPDAPKAKEKSVVLARELSTQEFNARWEAYVAKKGLSKYPLLLQQFSKLVKEALLDDPTLRPAFMQVLPKDAIDPIDVPDHAKSLVRKVIAGKTLLEYMREYSSFSAGRAETAEQILLNGTGKIIVAVTDDVALYPLHAMGFLFGTANGRQVYFPLPDGSWLGLKGSGQQRKEYEDPLQIWRKFFFRLKYMQGGVPLKEAVNAFDKTSYFNGGVDGIIDMLGYAAVHKYPNGMGGLSLVRDVFKGLRTKDRPALVFNLSTPYSLIKFTQLIEDEEAFLKVIKREEAVLRERGLYWDMEPLTPKNLVLKILRNMGRVQGVKLHRGLYKLTNHLQDFKVFLGFEADNEEFSDLKSYRSFLITRRLLARRAPWVEALPFEKFVFRNGISLLGLKAGVGFILELDDRVKREERKPHPFFKDQARKLVEAYQSALARKKWVPDVDQALKELFDGYFSALDEKSLQKWQQIDVSEVVDIFRKWNPYSGKVDWQGLEEFIRQKLAASASQAMAATVLSNSRMDHAQVRVQLSDATKYGARSKEVNPRVRKKNIDAERTKQRIKSVLDMGPQQTAKQIAEALNMPGKSVENYIYGTDYLATHRNRSVKERVKNVSVRLARELTTDEFNAQWKTYIVDHNWGAYPLVLQSFDQLTKEALLDDSSLRPEFMLALPAAGLGKIEKPPHQHAFWKKVINGTQTMEEFIKDRLSFKVHSVQIAESILASGKGRIIVAVTDKVEFSNVGYQNVDNGRQVYFPLPDGTWLGLKGSGYNSSNPNDGVTEPKLKADLSSEGAPEDFWGIETLEEAQNSFDFAPSFNGMADAMMGFLGYVAMTVMPDSEGKLINVSQGIRFKNKTITPVLEITHTLSPHRLSKFHFLIKDKVNFARVVKKIKGPLISAGLLSRKERFAPDSSSVLVILKNIATAQAKKQNKNIFKESLHLQDFSFGIEGDHSESMSFSAYSKIILEEKGEGRDNNKFFRETGISVAGLKVGFELLRNINQYSYGREDMVPDITDAVKMLLGTYIIELNKSNRQSVNKTLDAFIDELAFTNSRLEVDWDSVRIELKRIMNEFHRDWAMTADDQRKMLDSFKNFEHWNGFVLPGGVQVRTQLDKLQLLTMVEEPERHYIVNNLQGIPGIKPIQMKWQYTDTSFEELDQRLEIKQAVLRIYAQRKDKTKPIVILDWGAGTANGLIGLKYWLDSQGIPYQIFGVSHDYYEEWEKAPDAVNLILDDGTNLGRYFEKNSIDLIYSSLGLKHLIERNTTYRKEAGNADRHMRELIGMLTPGGIIKLENFTIEALENLSEETSSLFKRRVAANRYFYKYMELQKDRAQIATEHSSRGFVANKLVNGVEDYAQGSYNPEKELAKGVRALTLAGGATLLTPINEYDLADIIKSPEKYYVTVGPSGYSEIELIKVKWDIVETTLRDLDDRYDIVSALEEVYRQRQDKSRPLIIVDWGAGNGAGVVGLSDVLKKKGIPHHIYALSSNYYPEWERAQSEVTFILEDGQNLNKYIKDDVVDLVYSNLGLIHFLHQQSSNQLQHGDPQEVMSAIISMLGFGGRIKLEEFTP